MFEPELVINYGAIFSATLVFFGLGWIWFGPLFGKAWLREMGGKADLKPEKAVLLRAILLNLIGNFLTVYVMAHMAQIWRPSVWNVPGAADDPAWMYGLSASFFTWIGFYVPVLLMGVAYENRSWKFLGINAFYYLTGLLFAGQILAWWR